MKQGNGLRTASAVIVVLLALVLFVFAGFRNEAADAREKTETVASISGDHEARLRVLESNLGDIRQSLQEIKQSLDADRREGRR